jgi:hypothetical protein
MAALERPLLSQADNQSRRITSPFRVSYFDVQAKGVTSLCRALCIAVMAFAIAAIAAITGRAQDVPANLGRGLGPMVGEFDAQRLSGKSEADSFQAAVATVARAQGDAQDRVLVDVMLDGKASLAQVRQRSEQLGGSVTAAAGWYRHGTFSVWLPLKAVEQLARTPGVSAVHLAPRHRLRIGAVTTQGAVVHKTDLVNNSGYLGAGVTVGVLSDSYDDDLADSRDPGWTTASQDVATGDLPGRGNPLGDTTPVDVLQDGDSPYSDTDEGRAMLQIVHDVAPAANLAFCTNGDTDSDMAENIRRLEDDAGCQVICDDVAFDDEPMFSDGVIAQAIDAAAANGVAYFSAIGNDGGSGYAATFNPVSNTTGRKQAAAGGVRVGTIPSAESKVIYEWHSFGTDTKGNPVVVQKITTGSGPTTLIFQWDDPFDVVNGGTTGITTDYDILVFNSAGDFSSHLSGTENNISANEPIELPIDNMKPFTTYKICIVLTTRTNGTQPRLATHLRYLATDGADCIIGDYINSNDVTATGHCCAAGCGGVAAYVYDIAPDPGNSSHLYTPLVDGYSSNGPVTIYFDSAGNRLTTPVTRNQPMFACTDNVDTTFFPPYPAAPNPYDYDDDGYPNFAGTSAATPHAAGIAALLLNAAAANNMSAPTPSQIQSILIATTQGQIDEDPIFCSGTAGPVSLTDSGDGDSVPNIFEIAFSGTAGQKLSSVTLDLSPVSMHFDTGRENGLPYTVDASTGKPRPTAGRRIYSGGSSGKSTMTLPFSHFEPGDTYSFSIGFDDDDTDMYGYDADELGGAAFSATVSGVAMPYTGTLGNSLGRTYNYKAGYGLLDAQAAVNMLLGQ